MLALWFPMRIASFGIWKKSIKAVEATRENGIYYQIGSTSKQIYWYEYSITIDHIIKLKIAMGWGLWSYDMIVNQGKSHLGCILIPINARKTLVIRSKKEACNEVFDTLKGNVCDAMKK